MKLRRIEVLELDKQGKKVGLFGKSFKKFVPFSMTNCETAQMSPSYPCAFATCLKNYLINEQLDQYSELLERKKSTRIFKVVTTKGTYFL